MVVSVLVRAPVTAMKHHDQNKLRRKGCLGVSISVKRHHSQSNSYKEKHLIGAGLQVQRFSPLSSRWEHGNIHAGMVQEEFESSTFSSEGCQWKNDFHAVKMRVL